MKSSAAIAAHTSTMTWCVAPTAGSIWMIYLDEPNEAEEERPKFRPKSKFSLVVESLLRKVRGEAHPAQELFTGALREAALFDDLLRKVGGDRSTVERLIEYERGQRPNATRLTCLQNAISRWEQENR